MGEKTEDPTAKRKADARQRGEVPKSQDVAAAALMFASIVLLAVFGGHLVTGLSSIMRRSLDPELLGNAIHTAGAHTPVVFGFVEMVRLVAPIMLLLALVAYIAQVSQVGWLVTLKPLSPKFKQLNVITGAKRLINKNKLIKGGIDLLKFTLIAAIAFILSTAKFGRVAALPSLTAQGAIVQVGYLLLETALWLMVIMILIGVIDLIFQRWRHKEKLKMTKHEVKDERKSAEGDPKVKARRFSLYSKIVQQQVQANVPRADVVVTNPTHFAVALKYDSGAMNAPRVVAKGADHLAIRIRLVAAAHGVPIVERPPLARALYYGVEVGREIPVEQYEAVAEVLAYVYRLEGRAAS